LSRKTALRVRRAVVRDLSRRAFLAATGSLAVSLGAGQALASPHQKRHLRFGLTPVFLTNDLELLTRVRAYLLAQTGAEIELIRRRTYQEITSLLVSAQLEAAWICGFPFVAFREQLSLIAVPVWRGEPLYSSYLIVAADRDVDTVAQLEGDVHAFSDPDSNSGHLVTRALLADMRRRPEEFFRRTIFTWGHRNVVRAVGSGLTMSGSVDGYIYDVLAEIEPSLTKKVRVVRRSELLGFPPIACPRSLAETAPVRALQEALLDMQRTEEGRSILSMLKLDGFVQGSPSLFDGIAEKVRQVRSFG
jgi:phosphonate transport system substrate-binding protein